MDNTTPNYTPREGNQNYRDVVVTATYRPMKSHEIVKEISAKGFESQKHAWEYFQQQVGRVSIEHGHSVWCSNLVASNGDFLCQAVPSYWANGVSVVL
jgi:hypothetical protein